MQEMQVRPLSQEDPLEKEMATHSRTLREISWTEEPGGLQSMGSQQHHLWYPPVTLANSVLFSFHSFFCLHFSSEVVMTYTQAH